MRETNTAARGNIPTMPYDRQMAVYVISHKKVYLPDGTEYEAHSGYGDYMDDPRFAHLRMRGVTPPHVYDLKMREALFHGVEAIRMLPHRRQRRDLRPRRHPGAQLPARTARPVAWLRVVQELRRIPRTFQGRKNRAASRCWRSWIQFHCPFTPILRMA